MSGAGPEAAVELFCEIADDIRALLALVEKTQLQGKEMVDRGDLVQSRLLDGQEKISEAIEKSDEVTEKLIDSTRGLIRAIDRFTETVGERSGRR